MFGRRERIARLFSYRKVIPRVMMTAVKKKFMPMAACLHITKSCNLKCVHCYAGLEALSNNSDPGIEEMIQLINECYEIGVRLIRLMGGEPLLRKDIGALIKHIKGRGMACEVITNGILIPGRIKELKPVDSLCISIDGGKEENDLIRGKGTWDRIIAGIKAAKEADITPRLHCVLTRYTMRSIERMNEISNRFGARYNIGDCSFETYKNSDFSLTQNEIRDFYKRYLAARRSKAPISNSIESILGMLNWPVENKVITYGDVEKRPGIKKMISECQFAHKEVFIDVDGMVYPCVRLWKKGFNYKELGLEEAWKRVSESRARWDCYICRELGIVERSQVYGGDLMAMARAYLGYF